MSASRGHEKQAGAMVYLMEELGDARLRCDQLQRYVDKATKLVDQSDHKDHLFEVAGDLIRGIPETVFKLHKSLQAVALAAGRIDYEEIKQDLRPEKAEELERVLKDVRIRHVQRRSEPMKPIDALNALKTLKAKVEATGKFPITETLNLIAALEEDEKEEGSAKEASSPAHSFDLLSRMLTNPPEGSKGPSRQRLAQILRSIVGSSINREDLTAFRVATLFEEREAGQKLDFRDLNNLKKYLEDIVVEAKKDKNSDIEALAQKAIKQMKMASDDEKEAGDEEKEANASDVRSLEILAKDHGGVVKNQPNRFEVFFKSEEQANAFLRDTVMEYPTLKGAFKVTEGASNRWWAIADMKRIQKLASDDDKEARFEEGKPADPTKDMSPEDAKKWKENTEEYGDKFKKEAADTSKLERVFGNIERQVKEFKYSLGIYKKDPGKNAPQMKNIEEALNGIRQSAQIALRAISKTASDEDKEGRFEEGKPADPTKNMSPEDAKKWKENVDHDGSNIKKAGRLPSPSDLTKQMKDAVSSILKTRVLVRDLAEMIKAVEEDASGAGISYSGSIDKLTNLRKKLRDLDADMTVFNDIESQMKTVKTLSKSASDEDKQSRFEEGKPADPTKDMSPEDAKKWKENTEEYGDKFKKEAAKIDEAAATNLKSVKVSVDNLLKGQNPKRNSFTAIQSLGEAMEIMGQGKVSEVLYTTANKINSLWSAKDMAEKKASSDPWKAV